MQAALQCVHRAALHAAVLGLHAVLDCDQAFRILGGDAEYAGQPAPEHSARAAEEYRRTHADNIARADGGSQRGRQRLKLTDIARRIRIFLNRQPDAGKGLALDKAGAHRHKQVGAE